MAKTEPDNSYRKSTAREYFESICVAVILALFVRTFIVQAFKIPTGSMENNLLIGDHLLVNKFVFAPTLNAAERTLLPIDPIRRGDIIAVHDAAGAALAYGIANYDSDDARKLKGLHSGRITEVLGHHLGDEVIHRDNVVLL